MLKVNELGNYIIHSPSFYYRLITFALRNLLP